MQPFLSICIPTYNGKAFLEYNINKFIKLHEKYNFEVCVSDNASNDDTQSYMLDIITKYNFVKYHRNRENFGMAYNFDKALEMGTGEYRWLLGDDDEIIENKIESVIDVLRLYNPEICIVNAPGINGKKKFINNVNSGVLKNKNFILGEFAGLMTWISSCILSKKVVEALNIKNVNDNIFPHTIEILNYLNRNCYVYWIDEICAKIQNTSSCRYSGKILEYSIKDWCELTKRIHGYDDDAIKNFIKSTSLLEYANFINLLRYKKENILNFKILKRINPYFKYYPFSLRIKFYIAQLFPRFLLKFLARAKLKIKEITK